MRHLISSCFLITLLSLPFGTSVWADDVTSTGVPDVTEIPGAIGGDSGTTTTDPNAVPNPNTVPTPVAPTIDNGAPASPNQYNQMMEKCKVTDSDGNGLIKPYMADSGINLAGDANAWIWVPYGQCAKINAGDFTDISPDILAKIDTSNIRSAKTLGN